MVDEQLSCVRRRLAAVQRMPEVQQHAHIVESDLLDTENRSSGRVPRHLHAWLARLVFDRDAQIRVGRRQIAHAIDCESPQIVMVDLEGVVPAILPGPDLEVLPVECAHDLRGLVHELEGLRANARVRVGKRALAEAAKVDLGGDPGDKEVVGPQRIAHLVDGDAGREGIGNINGGQLTHLTGAFDHLQSADRWRVAVGGIAVDVAGEVPQAGTEGRVVGHAFSSGWVGVNRERATATRQWVLTCWRTAGDIVGGVG